MNKYLPYIIVGLLICVLVQGFLQPKVGYTDEEVADKIKLHDLQQDYNLAKKENQLLEVKLKTVTNEILKKDTIIGGYNKLQLDSFFTDFLK